MRKRGLLLVSMFFLTFTGCSKIMDATQTSIYVDKKGTVTEAIIEDFDKDNYNQDELKKNVEQLMTEYNDQAGEDVVELKKFQVKDAKTKVILKYHSYQDYKKFNNLELFAGTLKEAKKLDFDMGTTVYDVANEKTHLSLAELLEQDQEYQVVVVKEPIQVEVAEEIIYLSENAKLADDKIAEVIASGTHTNEQVQSVMSDYAYILYK